MRGMELYIIRHGQSSNNALDDQEQGQRHHDSPLTDRGQQQAERLAAFLAGGALRDPWMNPATGYTDPTRDSRIKATHFYCSPMTRTLQTALPVARALGIWPQVWVEIHEHGGVYLEQPDGATVGYPGRTRSEILSDYPDYVLPEIVTERGWYNGTGHESMAACYGRSIQVANELHQRAKDDANAEILMITHGTFMNALIKSLLNQLPGTGFYYLHYNTSITRLTFREDGRLLVRYMNRVDHLPPELIS